LPNASDPNSFIFVKAETIESRSPRKPAWSRKGYKRIEYEPTYVEEEEWVSKDMRDQIISTVSSLETKPLRDKERVYVVLGIESLNTLTKRLGKKEGLRKAFNIIHDIDYKSIYDIALQVVEHLPDTLFEDVINRGAKLGSNHALLKRDFSGRIYHKIVGDWSVRKGFATFFTTIPASYLIAYLAIFSEQEPYSEGENVKVADFACGSGTLLTAAYSALEDLYKLERFEEGDIDLDAFHKKLLEQNFWGFDALRYALQIASLNLVFHNPTIALKTMNFYSIPLGITKKNIVELGSLRFLKSGTLVDYFSVDEKAKKAAAVDSEEESTNLPFFNLIIMNPPFTRATGRGGKKRGGLFGFIVDEDARQTVLKEYGKARSLVRSNLTKIGKECLNAFKDGTFKGIGAAGEGLLFLYLAFQHLDDNGKIAFVLPKSVLNGASWFLIRTLIFQKMHLEYVIVSYDKENMYNFSESTSMSEALIIARKTKAKDTNERPTKFVMLAKKPLTSFTAKALAKAIINNGSYAEAVDSYAYTCEIPYNEMRENIDNWGRFVAFPNLKLLSFLKELNNGKLFNKEIPMKRLGKLATVGIDRHQFHTNFKMIARKASGSHSVIYGGDEEQRKFLQGKFNAFIMSVNQKAEKTFEDKASYLLIPDRIRLNTAHIISMCVPSKTLSNIFYAVKLKKHETIEKYKALCVWLNSTFGLLLVIANREETEGAFVSLKMSHWRLQNILNINKLKKTDRKRLSEIFDKYLDKEMQRLPQQYNPQAIDTVRLAFDKEILNVLGIKIEEERLIELYKLVYEAFSEWFDVGKTNANLGKYLKLS
jgi:type I restriction-modification system DNA methylase subunit